MKFDLAELMKKKLNEINKIKKKSFVQLIPLGITIGEALASLGASLFIGKLLHQGFNSNTTVEDMINGLDITDYQKTQVKKEVERVYKLAKEEYNRDLNAEDLLFHINNYVETMFSKSDKTKVDYDIDIKKLLNPDKYEEEEKSNEHEVHFIKTFITNDSPSKLNFIFYIGFKTKEEMNNWTDRALLLNIIDMNNPNCLYVLDENFISEETKDKVKAFVRCKSHDKINIYEYDGHERTLYDISNWESDGFESDFSFSGYIMHIFSPDKTINHDPIYC